MPRVGVMQDARTVLVDGVKHRCETVMIGCFVNQRVHTGHDLPATLAQHRRVRSDARLQRSGQQSGGDSLTRDIGDQKSDPLGAKRKKVEIVAADAIGRPAHAGIIERRQFRAELREETLSPAQDAQPCSRRVRSSSSVCCFKIFKSHPASAALIALKALQALTSSRPHDHCLNALRRAARLKP